MVRYVGIDVSKKRCRAAIMNSDGFIVDELLFNNDHEGIDELLRRLSLDDKVVMESTGNLWVNLYDTFEEYGIEAVLANPMKTKAIASARIKNDKLDSRILAQLLKGDLVAESYVPSKRLRDVRALIRHRASIVKIRTMVKNRVHTLIDRYGLKHDLSDLFGKEGLNWLKSLELKPLDKLMLNNHLTHIQSLNEQIRRVDEDIDRIASNDEDAKLLMSMSGIDVYTALLIISEIGEISRFTDYKKLVSYAGLAPSLHQSGSISYTGRITKQGSRMLRWIMVEAARVAVRHDPRMNSFYKRVAHRRGEQKAIIAVANKMLKIIWYMLTRREPYQSRNKARYRVKLNKLSHR